MQVQDGVHLVETYANTFILTGQRVVIVDTSAQERPAPLLDAIRRLNVKPRDVTSIIITHTHPDHVTGLAAVKNETGAKVAAHEIEAPFVSKQKIYDGPPGPQAQKHVGVPVDVRLKDGQAFDGFRVVHTPGHTRGNIALLDSERDLLIAGDSVTTDPTHGTVGTSGIGTMDDRYNVDPKAHRASIKRLAQFDFEALVCGHGPPIAHGASKKLKEFAARL